MLRPIRHGRSVRAARYLAILAMNAVYGSMGNSSDIPGNGLCRLANNTLSFGEANPSGDKSNRTFCSNADIFSTTRIASSL
jgi:hypothetical protein